MDIILMMRITMRWLMIFNNKTYKLGQRVTIKVAGTDRMLRTIDFEMVSAAENVQSSHMERSEQSNGKANRRKKAHSK